MLAPLMDEAGLPHTYDPGALKITISKFYRPSGASTQLRGVASDIVLPSGTDFADVSESSLDDPLPWDSVAPAAYERLNRVAPHLPVLRDASTKRVKADRGFALLLEDIGRLGKSLKEKSVVLNEAERRKELAENKARRKEERAARAKETGKPVAFEITLANVDKPGLPPPLPADGSGAGGKNGGTAKSETKSESKSNGAAEPVGGSGRELDRDDESRGGGDVIMDESVRVLTDYIGLLGGRGAAAPKSAPTHP